MKEENSSFQNVNATRVIATTIGVFFGLFSGINHGIFEILQGNAPTNGLVISAIGEAQRFWVEANEPAFTIVPNLMITGNCDLVDLVPAQQTWTQRLPGAFHSEFSSRRRHWSGFLLSASLGFCHAHGQTADLVEESVASQHLAVPVQVMDRFARAGNHFHIRHFGDWNFWLFSWTHKSQNHPRYIHGFPVQCGRLVRGYVHRWVRS